MADEDEVAGFEHDKDGSAASNDDQTITPATMPLLVTSGGDPPRRALRVNARVAGVQESAASSEGGGESNSPPAYGGGRGECNNTHAGSGGGGRGKGGGGGGSLSSSNANSPRGGGGNNVDQSASHPPLAPIISSFSSFSSSAPIPPPTTGPGSGRGIDAHPYSRGSVIEVVYVRRRTGGDGGRSRHRPANSCRNAWSERGRDMMDGMDEWITMERIVSPPSIGNAKMRALKKMEERRKREEEERRQTGRTMYEVGSYLAHSSSSLSVGLRGGVDVARGGSGSGISDGGVVISSDFVGPGVTGAAIPILAPRKRLRRMVSSAFGGATEDPGADVTTTTTKSGVATPPSTFWGGEASEAEAAVVRLTRRQRGGGGGGGAGSIGPGGPSSAMIAQSSSAIGMMMVAEEITAVDVVTTIAAPVLDEHEGMDAAALKEHEEVTKVKNVSTLELGKFRMDTWYFSPLPKELLRDSPGGMIDVLYVDEFSFNFFTRKEELLRYQQKTFALGNTTVDRRHPPGNEIYRCGNLSSEWMLGIFFTFALNHIYITLLSFVGIAPLLMSIMKWYHPVGYYSKEKYSDVGYNLACILTFPSHQRKGYGRFLIAFSYELSKKEEKVGSPEKPMSDLGQQAYIPYWTSTIVDFLLNHSKNSKSMSIMDIAKKTSIMAEDIIFALNTLGILKFVNGVYFIYAERAHLETLAKKHPVKEPRVDPNKLHWTPYITDVKRDKFSISSKKPSVEADASINTAN
ncbi:hypothetical protein ACHAXA_010369 [Cyclostephanos tholiformis]|uniref:Histone acetyltransferase n=1 Tax=Cyclostephanos tholiformis TaxID=382380 RepID=A0ABD3RV27_9STRA